MSGRSRTRRLGLRCGVLASLAAAMGLASPALAAPGPRVIRVTGQVAAPTRMHVTVALRPRDSAALQAYAQAVSTPGSPVYGRFLGPGQFGRRFGAAPAAIAAVRSALKDRGLGTGQVSLDRLSVSVTAPAGTLEHGLRLSLLKLELAGHRTAVAASATPSLGRPADSAVQAVLGLGSLSAPQPLLVRPALKAADRAGLARAHVVTGGPQPCAAARNDAAAEGVYTSDQLASAYGFTGLFSGGDTGAGITAAVYELEPVDPSDLAAYEACYHVSTPISFVPVDGGPGSGEGTGEAALDIETLLSYAPGAHVLVYQGPNSSSGAPGAGPYDTYRAIFDQDRAQVVSASWGECEAVIGPAAAAAENTLFEQAAVQGQTVVSAGGDSGSEDCTSSSPVPQPELAVDDPASQPFVMGVGGTHLGSLGPRPVESVWNNGATDLGLGSAGAGGGGFSGLWSMPAAQKDAAAALNVLGAGSTGSDCGHPDGYCREVPDVSADADPDTGYEIYWNGSSRATGQTQGWQAFGGTSAAAPLWAGLMALADASSACRSGPIGYVLPALYRVAGTDYAGAFNDVRTGNNDYTDTNGGRWTAGTAYDEASGLGSPNASVLAPRLCSAGLRLTLATERSAQRSNVSWRVPVVDAPGAVVSLALHGLPPGLRFSSRTRRVTGRPRRTGRYHVSIDARDGQGASAKGTFSWQIGGRARITSAVLAIAPSPRLRFTAAAGRSSPALRRLLVALPAGLRLVSARGVRLGSGHAHPRFRATISHRRLVIVLRRAAPRVVVSFGAPGMVRARRGRQSAWLGVTMTDTASGTTELSRRVRRR